MIQEQEATLLLNDEIVYNQEQINPSAKKTLYQLLGQLNGALKKQVLSQNFPTLKHSLAVVEKLYLEGNNIVQHSIENVIVFSFFDFVNLQPKDRRRKIHALFPIGIYSAYIRQVNSCAH